jgi:hypothetical protein
MWGYGLKLAAAMIGILILGFIAIWIFGDIWYRVGIGAALVVVVGGLLLGAWYIDRRDREARADIDELPPV